MKEFLLSTGLLLACLLAARPETEAEHAEPHGPAPEVGVMCEDASGSVPLPAMASATSN